MMKRSKVLTIIVLLLLTACSEDDRGVLENTADNINPSTGPNKVQVARAGIDIENNNAQINLPPEDTALVRERYWWNVSNIPHDFNSDGIIDYVYIGTMNPDNVDITGNNTGGLCGDNACSGRMPGPTIYFGQPDGTYVYNSSYFIDDRSSPGQSAGYKLLIADYNNDGASDAFISDTAIGTHNGFRDSYFLSQPDGTLLESSNTHLSDPEFQVFDHGAATGDIDNDGDMDIVITSLSNDPPLLCWMNNGTGMMTKASCGGQFAFALEMADMDSDGDLDAVLAGHEDEGHFTGIAWNNGYGGFYETTQLPQHVDWPTVPEVSMADLDGDGDMDIVYSRAGYLYVGTAIQILENNGDRTFVDHGIIKIIEAPSDYVPEHEGNEWNDFIDAIRFNDVDNDNDLDIFLSSNSLDTYGTILINNGNYIFRTVKVDDLDYPVEIIEQSKFIDSH